MLVSALQYLLVTIGSLLTMMFLLRFFMQLFRASFSNPLGQMVITLTDFVVKPVRKWIPSWKKADLSTLLLAWLTQVLLILASHGLRGTALTALSWTNLLGLSLLGLVKMTFDVFFYTLILQAILSWVNPHTPIASTLDSLTRPILAPIRRIIPMTNGIDFSPLVALILLQMLNVVVIASLENTIISIF